jgi:hypothetical protein
LKEWELRWKSDDEIGIVILKIVILNFDGIIGDGIYYFVGELETLYL